MDTGEASYGVAAVPAMKNAVVRHLACRSVYAIVPTQDVALWFGTEIVR